MCIIFITYIYTYYDLLPKVITLGNIFIFINLKTAINLDFVGAFFSKA